MYGKFSDVIEIWLSSGTLEKISILKTSVKRILFNSTKLFRHFLVSTSQEPYYDFFLLLYQKKCLVLEKTILIGLCWLYGFVTINFRQITVRVFSPITSIEKYIWQFMWIIHVSYCTATFYILFHRVTGQKNSVKRLFASFKGLWY